MAQRTYVIPDSDDEEDPSFPGPRPSVSVSAATQPARPQRLSLPGPSELARLSTSNLNSNSVAKAKAPAIPPQKPNLKQHVQRILPTKKTSPNQSNDGPGTFLRQQLLEVDHRLDLVQQDLDRLTAEKAQLVSLKQGIEQQLREAELSAIEAENTHYATLNRQVNWAGTRGFAWSEHLEGLAKQFFNIDKFRARQLEVMNATLSNRDVFMVASTGHGKSLTYQLPALMHPSITLVISPLVSLSRDQVLGLQERGIRAEMIWSETSKEDVKRIENEMLWGADGKKPSKPLESQLAPGAQTNGPPECGEYLDGLGEDEEPYEGGLRLVYVTPEKIAKSKRFVNLLEKCYARGRIARIVVDEAHCVSQYSHDFRPDYKKLGVLKQLFPNVPMLALSATCPPSLITSCFTILGLRTIESDPRSGCFVWSSELYRRNLHYKVVSKSSSAEDQVSEIAEWIAAHHPEETGIVYTLTRKDAETTALGLQERGIRAGVYHADCDPKDRDRVHQQWRDKTISVVCATIAFGLGIDLPSVRYVLHASLSKSVEGYYQESGRAGRDGFDADCVLFYRPNDFTRIAAMTAGEQEAKRGIMGMLSYAEDMSTCRRILMDRYFGKQPAKTKEETCGHCDNCLRADGAVKKMDVTKHAYDILRLLDALKSGSAKAKNEKLTLIKLIDVWRGRNSSKLSASVTSLVPAQSKKELTQSQMERIVIACVMKGLIEEDFHYTAYSSICYLRSTQRGGRFVRLYAANPGDVSDKVYIDDAVMEEVTKKKRKRKSVGGATESEGGDGAAKKKKQKGKEKAVKKKGDEEAILIDDSDEEVEDVEEPEGYGYHEEEEEYYDGGYQQQQQAIEPDLIESSVEEIVDEEDVGFRIQSKKRRKVVDSEDDE